MAAFIDYRIHFWGGRGWAERSEGNPGISIVPRPSPDQPQQTNNQWSATPGFMPACYFGDQSKLHWSHHGLGVHPSKQLTGSKHAPHAKTNSHLPGPSGRHLAARGAADGNDN